MAESDSAYPPQTRFAIIGDYGQTAANASFPIDEIGQLLRNWNPSFIVTLGDNNYVLGQTSTIGVNVGKNFGGFISSQPGANRFFPVLGNHDYGDWENDFPPTAEYINRSDPYLNYFRAALSKSASPGITLDGLTAVQLPDGDMFYEPGHVNLRYYKLSRGPVDFFYIDSNPCTPYGHSPDGYQGQWLKAHLAASTAPWKIVIFHHPPYTTGSGSTPTTYMRWPFKAWGADVVITGHVHNYERFQKSDDGSPATAENSIPYIVNGAGGFVPEQGFANALTDQSKVRIEEYGFQWCLADASSLTLMFIDRGVVIRDTITLYRDASTAPKIVEFDSYMTYVAANAGKAQVTIQRGGDISQPLDVTFGTIPGTAKPDIDYKFKYERMQLAANQQNLPVDITIYDRLTAPSLVFNAALMSPSPGTELGYFQTQAIVLDNSADTPLHDNSAFVKRTFLDLLVREPTSQELSDGVAYLSANSRARYVVDVVLSDSYYSTEPAFRVAQLHSLIYMSPEAIKEKASVLITYTDLETWTTKISGPNPEPLWKVAQGFGQNALEILYQEHPHAKTITYEFLFAIYDTLVGVYIFPYGDDRDYWEKYASPPVTTNVETRYAMLASLATESFPPPAYPNVTAFDLPKNRASAIRLAMLYAGLTPTLQLSYEVFDGILKQIEQHKELLVDVADGLINSSAYAARFRPGPPLPPLSGRLEGPPNSPLN